MQSVDIAERGSCIIYLPSETDTMNFSSNRRTLLQAISTLPLAIALSARGSEPVSTTSASSADAERARSQLVELERSAGGRLGVCGLDTGSNQQIQYRAGERFPFCSTFKFMLAGAVLARSERQADLLQRRIRYRREALMHYSPVTERHVRDGMTVAELCAAAIQYSDNTAANQLIKLVGGPAAVTAFARSIGDTTFRLDRWETVLNTAIPGDLRDTSTPAALVRSFQALVLGNALHDAQRAQLQAWLRGNQTGKNRIASVLPAGWQIGDKTGTGDYGTTNDIAVIWPPSRAPIVLAVYYTGKDANAPAREDVVAGAARIVLGGL